MREKLTLTYSPESGEGYLTPAERAKLMELARSGLLGADVISDWLNELESACEAARAVMREGSEGSIVKRHWSDLEWVEGGSFVWGPDK